MRYDRHMRASLCVLLFACQSEAPPTPTSPTPVAPVNPLSDAAIAVTPAIPPNTFMLSPLTMDGPYASANEACQHAKPCGFTDINEKGDFIKPQIKTSCPALASSEFVDPNATDPSPKSMGINMAQLAHTSKDLQLRIGSQSCAAPKGIRAEHDIYYMFVKRADGWWRSEPLWQWRYNDKYESGTMLVRWNDQPGRTFAGIAAGLDALECSKQGYSHSTLELMVRVEPGTKTPVVFAPLVVGERFALEPMEPVAQGIDCKASKRSTELTEHWSSDDDLELTGAGSWSGVHADGSLLEIGFFGEPKPSSVGHYRFTR